MKPYQKEFIQFAIANNVLKFGEFTLKSGRLSPYFFNAGMFCDGNTFYRVGQFYADAIEEKFHDQYDVLFGPAYKGISLATSASIGLKIKFDLNVPVSFNRKEAKDHGEGGNIIGADLKGKRVLLIDDVITAGATIHHSVDLIKAVSGTLVGIVLALDRQEKGLNSKHSAIQEIENKFALEVGSIVTLDNLVEYLSTSSLPDADKHLVKISSYLAQYGYPINRNENQC